MQCGGSDGQSVCLQCGRTGFDPWEGKIPWRQKWQPTPVLLPGKVHGRRNLVGYKSWGCKELDTTERLHFHFQYIHKTLLFSLKEVGYFDTCYNKWTLRTLCYLENIMLSEISHLQRQILYYSTYVRYLE